MQDNNWAPPVEFYFQVQFHLGSQRFTASFQEVSGLEQELKLQELSQAGDDGVKIRLPKEVVHGNITLKRALEPLTEDISNWVNKCFNYATNGFISPCNMVISLMDSGGKSVACWSCNHAFPIKWNLGTLDAQRSGLAIETMTITYNRLERKK